MITIERYHDFSAGHRVYGHENKCANLHGHNYRITFTLTGPELDDLGRLVDFSVVKTTLCQWLEDNWDHKMLLWDNDPYTPKMEHLLGIIRVPFNPTAENMAKHLVCVISPLLLPSNICLIKVRVEETRKCSATYKL